MIEKTMHAQQEILKAQNLTKSYDGKMVLDIPRMSFTEGKVYGLVGPNAAGKTTFLNIIGLLEEPMSGEVFFYGKELLSASKAEKLDARRHITLVMQEPFIFHTTVLKNVAYGLRARSLDKKQRLENARSAIERVGLAGSENRVAHSLSAGEKQRLALARAIVLSPKLLLLDEPTSNIDRRNVEVVESLILDICKNNGATVILTTHDLSQAYRLCDQVTSLLEGRPLSSTPENIFSGTIHPGENGSKWAHLARSVKLRLNTEREGRATVSINPRSITISSSANPPPPCKHNDRWNLLSGEVTRLASIGDAIVVSVDVGVELVAIVDRERLNETPLHLGRNACLAFESSAVEVH